MKKENLPNDQSEARLAQLFSQAKQLEVEAPLFLESRVLAQLRERAELRRTASFWRRIALVVSAAAACLALVVGISVVQPRADFQAALGKPQVVRVAVDDLDNEAIANAEIVLPDGVYFYSESYPEIRVQRELKFAWTDGKSRAALPFVIQGEAGGMKQVRVRFYDKDGGVLAERTVTIAFTGKQS